MPARGEGVRLLAGKTSDRAGAILAATVETQPATGTWEKGRIDGWP